MQKIGDFYIEPIGTCIFLYAEIREAYFLVKTFDSIPEARHFAKVNEIRSGVIGDKIVYSIREV